MFIFGCLLPNDLLLLLLTKEEKNKIKRPKERKDFKMKERQKEDILKLEEQQYE
jgi:hypothetical protein